ncbi:hypothetical protein I4F81_001540 [Pyropia yezoensis]|uniref:Uncharacterized protein n=1 Tax=Pyropia yezoensis TaxID=2788 RepID=A0ACC3BMG5_PYRYE|nr:hypothetical protein I4F81_001540 [Neopyropia yezoensis]
MRVGALPPLLLADPECVPPPRAAHRLFRQRPTPPPACDGAMAGARPTVAPSSTPTTRPPLWVLAPPPLYRPARVAWRHRLGGAAPPLLFGRRLPPQKRVAKRSARAVAPLVEMTATAAAAAAASAGSGPAAAETTAAAGGPAVTAARRPAAVVIGAGPAGALAALHLARGGYSPVTVVEARAPPSPPFEEVGRASAVAGADAATAAAATPPRPPDPSRRSYSIVLNGRGLAALADFPGLPAAVAAVGVAITGSCRYGRKGPRAGSGFPGGAAANVSVDRGALVGALYRYATEVAPPGSAGGIDWVWRYRVVGVDWAARVVTAESEAETSGGKTRDGVASGGRVTYPYDLLVVAQGVYSSVRDEAVAAGLLTYEATPDEMEYKIAALGNPAGWHSPPPRPAAPPPEPTSAAPHPCPRSGTWLTFFAHQPAAFLLAPPWVDAAGYPSVRAVVGVSAGGWSQRLTTVAAIEGLFVDRFPDVYGPGVPPPAAVVEDLLAQPVSVGGVTGVCSRYDLAGGTAVLVGDCAASCWPSLGQGCNVALAGVAALGATLFPPPPAAPTGPATDGATAATPPPPHAVVAARLAAHTAAWKPNADAAGEVSARGFGRNARVMTRPTVARLAAVAVASRLLGTPGPALMRVGDPAVPYELVLRRWCAQEAAVNGVAGGVGLATAVGVAAWVVPRLLAAGGGGGG